MMTAGTGQPSSGDSVRTEKGKKSVRDAYSGS